MDILYSQRILTFRKHALSLLRHVLQTEMGIQVNKSRFLYKGYLYPLTLVCYNNGSTLGYCAPAFFEIGLHVSLIDSSDELLLSTIRHELAHLFTYLEYGDVAAHGSEFKATCTRFGFTPEVACATIDEKALEKKSSLLSKVTKLLALSNSANQEEAFSALCKAKELIQKYDIHLDETDEWCMRRVLFSKKTTQKLETIASILRFFSVIPSFHRGETGTYLTIFGEKNHVDSAAAIAGFLHAELEKLWAFEKRKKIARSSKGFFLGIALGFKQQMERQEVALIPYEIALAKAFRTYLRGRERNVQHEYIDPKSLAAGKAAGKSLRITENEKKERSLLSCIRGYLT